MHDQIAFPLRTNATPRSPVRPPLPATHLHKVLKPLPRTPRAVLFDIYGTLFLSASGDVGTALSRHTTDHFQSALEAVLKRPVPEEQATRTKERYFDEIRRAHQRAREQHKDEPGFVPEIDIRSIWHDVLEASDLRTPKAMAEVLAVHYEARSNPVWPMPGALSVIHDVRNCMALGIVSNAQFYTMELPRLFWGTRWTELGFADELSAFSFREGRAKPDPRLFEAPLASLRARGIDSGEVVYIGNDVRNDMITAKACGCMSVLFAGDRTSLRLRLEIADSLSAIDSIVFHLKDVLQLLAGGGDDP